MPRGDRERERLATKSVKKTFGRSLKVKKSSWKKSNPDYCRRTGRLLLKVEKKRENEFTQNNKRGKAVLLTGETNEGRRTRSKASGRG